jgi:hypothetical protein
MKRILFLFTILSCTIFYAQGYQFLGSYTSDGTPLYFVTSDVISTSTMTLVNNSLPENYPVPTYNPQYISSGYDTDVIIDSLADVWVTFVKEGAGYKNVLGFYTYDLNNPPTTAPTASQITIVFPNVSAQGSGGSLVAGNKVKIGTFPAGTGIGWVLLANGWNGTAVTNGLWRLFSNPNFNPESDPNLRQHNVLLNDPENQRIILGFEDIRRDNNSCDNDFNDAIFYVSANPYEALRITNTADISSATDVTSANNGGLESKGDLATLIAKRNFNRIKTNSFADTKAKQTVFTHNTTAQFKSNNSVNFSTLLPQTGMFGAETTFVSSPTDLVGITNALQVYSVDYYQGNSRVAAVLATQTTDGIYGHSKAICDRLNNSSLEDVRTIILNGFEIVMVKIKRANGAIEFALNFSVQQLAGENKLHSYWNINQYPTGDYTNFQVWGSSMGQVCSITNYILTQFQNQGTFTEDTVTNRIPSVFVKSGYYRNGELHLKMINKSGDSQMSFTANKKQTELSSLEPLNQIIPLSGAFEQDLNINTEGLFDIGLAIQGNNSPQSDALYMADGPWGLDYVASENNITNFEISNDATQVASDEYKIERNVNVAGQVYGTVNLFRNILPGELNFNADAYSSVSFTLQNSLPVEVVLVTEGLSDWNNRFRIALPAHNANTTVTLSLSDFVNATGESFNQENVKGFVFSTSGNYTTQQPFAISVSYLKLGNTTALGLPTNESLSSKALYNYPNPCHASTTLVLPNPSASVSIKIIDQMGRVVAFEKKEVNQFNHEVSISTEDLNLGIYILEVTTDENKKLFTKFLKN